MTNEERRNHVKKVQTVREATISDHKPKRMVLISRKKA